MALVTIPDLDAQLQWERVDRTDEGPINRVELRSIVLAENGALLLSSGDGLYRVTGISGVEKPVVDRVLPDFVGRVIKDGERLYAVGLATIFRSEDKGKTWNHYYTIPEDESLREIWGDTLLLVRSQSPSHLRRLDLSSGSSDTIEYPDNVVSFSSLYLHRSGHLYFVLLGPSLDNLLVSDDWGESWNEVTTTWPSEVIGLDYFTSLTPSFLIAGKGSSMIISRDGGRSWEVNTTYPGGSLVWVESEDRVLSVLSSDEPGYLSSSFTIYTTADSGATWDLCTSSGSRTSGILEDGTLYTQREGILEYADHCRAEWRLIGERFRNVSVKSIQSSGSIFFATIERPGRFDQRFGGNYDLYRSSNDGVTWEFASGGLPESPTIDNDGNLWLPVDTTIVETRNGVEVLSDRQQLLRSIDRGETWTRPLAEEGVLFGRNSGFDIATADNGTLLIRLIRGNRDVSTSSYVSTDRGANYQIPGDWTDSGDYRPAAMVLRPDGKILSVGSRWEGKGQYIDYGFNLLDPLTGETEWLGGPDLNYLQVSDDGTVYGWTIGVLKKSEDGGRTWTDLTMPALITDFANTVVEKPGDLLFLKRGNEVHLSRDQGSTWTPYLPPVVGTGSVHQVINTIPLLFDGEGTILDVVHLDETDSLRANRQDQEGYLYQSYTLVLSRDNGVTWDVPLPIELEKHDITSAALGPNNTLLIGTRNNGIYRATLSSSVDGEIQVVPVELDLR